MNWRTFVALFALVGAAAAVPTNRLADLVKPEMKCTNPSANLYNEIGKTYEFQFDSKNALKIEQGTDREVQMTGTLELTTIAACQHLLRMRNVQLSKSTESTESTQGLIRRLTESPVFFHQDAGHIRHIAHESEEDQQVLNIKRSLLSALQITSWTNAKSQEKDVYGRCSTVYETKSIESDRVHLERNKDLTSCSQRRHPIASLLWRNKEQQLARCEYELDRKQNVIKHVRCFERVAVAPLENTEASTDLFSQIELKHIETRESREEIRREQLDRFVRSSLAFQIPRDAYKHYQSSKEQNKLRSEAIEMLKYIREHPTAADSSAHLDRLADVLALLNAKSIASIDTELFANKQLNDKEQRVQRLFGDLLAQSESEAAIHYMFEQALQTEHPLRRSYWLLQLGSIQNARSETIEQLLPYLTKSETPREALLAIARIISASKVRSEQTGVWKQAVEHFVEHFDKESDKHAKIAVLYALKTVGMTEEHAIQLLRKVIKSQQSNEIRVAMIHAISAQFDLISQRVADQLFELYEQRQAYPAEVRIELFRALMRSDKHAKKVLQQLETETNKQVGYYVASYVRNIKANHQQMSEVPEPVRRMLEETKVPAQFENKPAEQKSSRHLRVSKLIELFDSELGLSGDVIVTEEDRISQLRLKLASHKRYADGEQFELRIRQKGVDRLINVLTTQLQSSEPSKLFKQLYELIRSGRTEQMSSLLEPLIREISASGENAYVSIELSHNKRTLLYVSSHDLTEKSHQVRRNKPDFQIRSFSDLLTLLSDASFNTFLIRREQLLPTITGLSLRTAIQSNVVAGIQLGNGRFRPTFSSSTQVFAGMRMSALNSGVAYKVKVESSPAFTYQIQRDQNGLPIKFTLNMDNNKMSLLRIQSVIEQVNFDGKWTEVKLNSKKSQTCLDSLRSVAAARFCFEHRMPMSNKGWQLPAPFELHFFVEKDARKESQNNGWEFEFRAPARYHPLANELKEYKNEPFHYTISYRMPGDESKENKFDIEMTNEKNHKAFKIDLQTTHQRLLLEARVQNAEHNHGFTLKGIYNQHEAALEAWLKSNDEYSVFTPFVHVEFPGKFAVKYEGEVSLKPKGKKDAMKITLIEKYTERTVFDLNVVRSGRLFSRQMHMSMEATFQPTAWHLMRYAGHFATDSSNFEFDHQYTYTFARSVPLVYSAAGKFSNIQPKSQSMVSSTIAKTQKYVAHMEYKLPTSGGEFTWSFEDHQQADQRSMESELNVFAYPAGQSEKARLLYALHKINLKSENGKRSVVLDVSAQSELINLNHEIQSKVQYDAEWKDAAIVLSYGRKSKQNVRTSVEWLYAPKNSPIVFKIDADLQTWFGEAKQYRLAHTIERKDSKYLIKSLAKWSEQQSAELQMIVSKEQTNALTQYEFDTMLRVPHLKIDYSIQNVVRKSAHIEIKSSIRDASTVLNKLRIFLSHSQPSSVFVENRFVNAKFELQSNMRNFELYLTSELYPFSHSTVYKHDLTQFEFSSQTLFRNVNYLDMSYKRNDQFILFVVQPGRQKINFHYDHKAHKGMLLIHHEMLFVPYIHHMEIGFVSNEEQFQAEAKITRNETPYGRFRFQYNYIGEASLKLTVDELRASLLTSNKKTEITINVEYPPYRYNQLVQLKRTSATRIEGTTKITYMAHEMTSAMVLDYAGKSSLTYRDSDYKFDLQADVVEKTAQMELTNSRQRFTYAGKMYLEKYQILHVIYSLSESDVKVQEQHLQLRLTVRQNGEVVIEPNRWFQKFPLEFHFGIKDATGAYAHETKLILGGADSMKVNEMTVQSTTQYAEQKYTHQLYVSGSKSSLLIESPATKWSVQSEYKTAELTLKIERESKNPSVAREFGFKLTRNFVSTWFDDKRGDRVKRMLLIEAHEMNAKYDAKVYFGQMKFEVDFNKSKQQPREMHVLFTFPTYAHLYSHKFQSKLDSQRYLGSFDYEMLMDEESAIKYNVKYDHNQRELISNLRAFFYEMVGSYKRTGSESKINFNMKAYENVIIYDFDLTSAEQRLVLDTILKVRSQQAFALKTDFKRNDEYKFIFELMRSVFSIRANPTRRELNTLVKLPGLERKLELDINTIRAQFDMYASSQLVVALLLNKQQLHATVYQYVFKADLDDNYQMLTVLTREMDRDYEAKFTSKMVRKYDSFEQEFYAKHASNFLVRLSSKFDLKEMSISKQLEFWQTITKFDAEWLKFARFEHSHLIEETPKSILIVSMKRNSLFNYEFGLEIENIHKLTMITKYDQEKQMQIDYLFRPSQLLLTYKLNKNGASRYEMSLRETRKNKFSYEFNSWFTSSEFNVNFKNDQQVDIKFDSHFLTSAQLSINVREQQILDLSAQTRPEFILKAKQGKRFELDMFYNYKQLARTMARYQTEAVEAKFMLDAGSSNYDMSLETKSVPYQFDHKTVYVVKSAETKLESKTEAKMFAYEIKYGSTEVKSNLITKYRFAQHKGQGEINYERNQQLQASMDYEPIGSTEGPFHVEGKMDMKRFPMQGSFFARQSDEKYTVDMSVDLKEKEKNTFYLFNVQVKDSADKRMMNFQTEVSTDLLMSKAAGRMVGSLKSKLTWKAIDYAFDYNLIKTADKWQNVIFAQYDQQTYGYKVDYLESSKKGDVEITLPKNQNVLIHFVNRFENEQVVYGVELYPNRNQEPTNKYTADIRYNVDKKADRVISNAKFTLGHTSMSKPILASVDFEYELYDVKPVQVRLTIDTSDRVNPIVGSFEVLNSQDKKAVSINLYQSEAKHLKLAAGWNLDLPKHHQSIVWAYNNNYVHAYEGGYEFDADFSRHQYALDLKSINKFNVEWYQTSDNQYVLDSKIASGFTRRAQLILSMNGHISQLNLFDNENKKYEYVGSVDFDTTQGLRVRLNDKLQQRDAAFFVVERVDKSFVHVKAKLEKQIRQVIRPSPEFAQALIDYSLTKLRMKETLMSLSADVLGDRFSTIGIQLSRDLYKIMANILPMDFINRIVGFIPSVPEQYLQAIRILYRYYEQFISNSFFKRFLPFTKSYISLPDFGKIWDKIKETAEGAWEQFKKLDPTQQTRRFIESITDNVAQIQSFFTNHILEFINLMREQTQMNGTAMEILNNIVKVFTNTGSVIRSFKLGELLMNAVEVIIGEPVWLEGNSIQWNKDQGLFELTVFVPKSSWIMV